MALNVAGLIGVGVAVQRRGGGRAGLRWLRSLGAPPVVAGNGYAANKDSVYASLRIEATDTVLVGDSLVDFGEWHELLGSRRVKNRGIGGDTTKDVLRRIVPIAQGKPANVIVWCGINDLQRGLPRAETLANYTRIVRHALDASDKTRVWLLPALPVNVDRYQQRVLPFGTGLHAPTHAETGELEQRLRELARDNPRVTFVPLEAVLAERQLKADYTVDGLHLNGPGLRQVALALADAGLRPDE